MIEKLRLPFPLLSDPDRELAIRPYGVVDEKDARNISLPAMVLVTPEGEEAWRFVSRDYADRYAEDGLLDVLVEADLQPAEAEPFDVGPARAGPRAMPSEQLYTYFRGARFAAIALARRHPEIQDEVDHYVAQVDRYIEGAKRLFRERKQEASSRD